MKKSLLTEILNRCQRDIPNHPEHDNFMHWTFIVQNNQIVSDGVNRNHEPPISAGYHGRCCIERGFKPKWHSELDAVRRCKRKLQGCEVVNVRLNKSGEVRLSMPCVACRNLLYVVNASKVFFTTEFGWGSYAY